jgi:cell division septal protein FtsQ
MSEIAYVDMRYSNGFAIGWRSAAETPATASSKHSDDSEA